MSKYAWLFFPFKCNLDLFQVSNFRQSLRKKHPFQNGQRSKKNVLHTLRKIRGLFTVMSHVPYLKYFIWYRFL